jgi:2-methylcitrate dehydratase PrpD
VSEGANATHIGRFLREASNKPLSAEVVDAAKKCLVDWLGVTVAGSREPVARAARTYAELEGFSLPIIGAAQDAEKSALVNGVAAHALDFDDTHIPTDSHLSAVTWATLLALAEPDGDEGEVLLRAFVAGYEVAAKLSGRRFGFSLQFRWFHPYAVIGRLASSAAAAVVMGLDEREAAQAVALSTTRASGLRGTLGGMGKPLQVGEAAKDGIVCARMANAGVTVDPGLLSPEGGFVKAFVQDGNAQLAMLDGNALGTGWAVLRTSFKPYACLHGIHPSIDPSIDAAMEVASGLDPTEVSSVKVYVAPGVKKVARFEDPQTPLEAKFSVTYCVAAALAGKGLGADGFSTATLNDESLRAFLPKIEVVPAEGRKMLDSAVEVTLHDGQVHRGETSLSRGHPGNPLSWDDLEAKFRGLVEPIYNERTAEIVSVVRDFERAGNLVRLQKLLRS